MASWWLAKPNGAHKDIIRHLPEEKLLFLARFLKTMGQNKAEETWNLMVYEDRK